MEVAPGIRLLTQGIVNFYLIEQGGRLVLVDAGAPGDWDYFVRTLAELGRTVDELEAVLVTHAHADHTGFAERARTEAGARTWIHAQDAASAKGAKQPKNDGKMVSYLFRAELYRTAISLSRRGGTKIIPIQEVSTFSDGEVIDVPGRPRAVHVPGHTPGSSSLFFEGANALLTGDALVFRNPLTGRTGPQAPPSGLNQDTDQAFRSLEVLERIPAQIVLSGHGDPWKQGAAEAVRLARAAGRS